MNSETGKQLAVFERKVLRKILGTIKINNCWRRLHNNELMQLYGDLDTVSFIIINRLRCIGHVNRMVYQVFANQPQRVGQEVDPNPDGGTVCMVI
jgi:hypothetical protein